MIALPELFLCFGDLSRAAALAEPLTGPLVQRLSKWAERHQVWLVAGSIAETNASQKPFNTTLLLDPRGQIAASYRKRHLFQIDMPEKVQASEANFFSPGQCTTCVTTECGSLGLGICFDLRFPAHFAALRAQGAEMLAVPSAFTQATGRDHWELLVRALRGGVAMLCAGAESRGPTRAKRVQLRAFGDY